MNADNTSVGDTAHKAIDQAVEKTSDTLRPVVDMLVAGVHDAVERLAAVATQAADKVEVTGEYVKDMQIRMGSKCRSYVRERPLTSVGVAVASGYLLAWLLRNRR